MTVCDSGDSGDNGDNQNLKKNSLVTMVTAVTVVTVVTVVVTVATVVVSKVYFSVNTSNFQFTYHYHSEFKKLGVTPEPKSLFAIEYISIGLIETNCASSHSDSSIINAC